MSSVHQSASVACFGPFEFNLGTGELRNGGIRIKLPDQSAEILACLLEHSGDLVTREELCKKLWPDDTFVDFDHGLNNAVNRLRDALGDSADHHRYIETLPRRGYRFVAQVQVNPAVTRVESEHPSFGRELAARPSEAKKAAESVSTGSPARRIWIGAAACGALLTLLTFMIGLNVGRWRDLLSGGPPAAPIHSVAVLPLENLTGDPSQQYFADGMTDALITDLAQFSELRVISRTSVMRYRDAKKALPQIGRELRVDTIVEGTVTRSGERVRIDARLIRAATDQQLWAASYTGDRRQVLGLQAEVAEAVASEVLTKVSPKQRARLASQGPVNPEAYEAYLKGCFLSDQFSVEEEQKALPYFHRASAVSPNYAPAYAGLADAYQALALLGGLQAREDWQNAKAAALKALVIDPTLEPAHRSLGAVELWYSWDLAGSEKEYLRAIELNPGDAEAYEGYSLLLDFAGRFDEALAIAKRAQDLDPISPTVGATLGGAYCFAGDYAHAIDQLQDVLHLTPGFAQAHIWLGTAYEGQRRFPEAVPQYKLAATLSPANLMYQAALGRAYAISGQREQALRILKEVNRLSKNHYISPTKIGLLYASLGDRPKAFAWFDRAYRERDAWLLPLPTARWVDLGLRSDARFIDLMRRVQAATSH